MAGSGCGSCPEAGIAVAALASALGATGCPRTCTLSGCAMAGDASGVAAAAGANATERVAGNGSARRGKGSDAPRCAGMSMMRRATRCWSVPAREMASCSLRPSSALAWASRASEANTFCT